MFDQVQAEIDVINNGWSPSTDRENSADSIGLMVYEGNKIKVYCQSHIISISYATSHDIYAAFHRFLIKLQHYGINQLWTQAYDYVKN